MFVTYYVVVDTTNRGSYYGRFDSFKKAANYRDMLQRNYPENNFEIEIEHYIK